MRYLSICSGIEAATAAWHQFGWEAAGFSEIEMFPSRVLAHRYGSNLPGEPPSKNGVPNYGDFTKIPLDELGHIDLLVGGTPCQAFSVAGKRLSLQDARGNLSLAYVVLAHELARSHGLRWAVWENVPGVLSTKDNAFGCFLSALVGGDAPFDLPKGIDRWPDAGLVAGPRARLAWRVLDAQYFGLAQRRRRVFVVTSFGDGGDPAAVLLERKGVRRHPPARGEARQDVTHPTAPCLTSSGRGVERTGETRGQDPVVAVEVAPTLRAGGNATGGDRPPGTDADTADSLIVQPYTVGNTLTARMYKGINSSLDEGQTPVLAFDSRNGLAPNGNMNGSEVVPTLRAKEAEPPFITQAHAFDARQSDVVQYGDMAGPLDTQSNNIAVAFAIQAGALRTNPNSGPDGVGVQADHAYTLEARAEVQAVAFSCKDYGNDAMTEVAPTMRAMGHSGSHANAGGQLAVAFAQNSRDEVRMQGGDGQLAGALAAEPGMKQTTYVAQAYDLRGREGGAQFEGPHETANIRAASGGSSRSYVAAMAVRRLTPKECERLQGFPDDYTLIPVGKKLAADGPRYKALGNSMAVPVMAWIGNRINQQE